jgi:hypothetical protein
VPAQVYHRRTLGTLIELTIDPGAIPRPMMQAGGVGSVMAMGADMPVAAMSTPVEPANRS